MSLVHSPDELDAMRRIKAAFDPLERMNPGKVLPDLPDSAGAAP
jgi:FAD/FMN-containing dehydrogenase